MSKIFFVSCLLIILSGCVQDSPNIKQIENMQFFIDNKTDINVIEVEEGLQYLVMQSGDPEGKNPKLDQVITDISNFGSLTFSEFTFIPPCFMSLLPSETLAIMFVSFNKFTSSIDSPSILTFTESTFSGI